jgi:hypothetical protein
VFAIDPDGLHPAPAGVQRLFEGRRGRLAFSAVFGSGSRRTVILLAGGARRRRVRPAVGPRLFRDLPGLRRRPNAPESSCDRFRREASLGTASRNVSVGAGFRAPALQSEGQIAAAKQASTKGPAEIAEGQGMDIDRSACSILACADQMPARLR